MMRGKMITRRMFTGGLALSRLVRGASLTRLTARPGDTLATVSPSSSGLRELGLRKERDALLYIPESSAKHEKAPLIVSLHGATRGAERGIELLRSLADEHGFLLLAPASTEGTRDVIEGGWGPDVAFINQ